MRTASVALTLLATLTGVAVGQDPTAATVTNAAPRSPFGFSLPSTLGSLSYSLSGSQSFITGSNNEGVSFTTALSGNLAYLSKSERHPFSAIYSGGYFHTSGTSSLYGSGSNVYQSLAFSQMYRTRRWVFLLTDGVSYSPQAPTTGLSGIAGVGDLGVQPVQTGIEPDQSILRNYGDTVANGLSGSASWQVTGKASMEGSASWQTLRFLNGLGFNSDTYTGTFGPSYRLDGRDTLGASAYYSYSSYSGFDFLAGLAGTSTTEVEGVNLQFSRVLSRRLSASVGIGPQVIHGSGLIPIASQTTLAADASLSYTDNLTTATLTYTRGANAGSGLVAGAFSDSINFGASRPLNRNWVVSLSSSFSRSSSLSSEAGSSFSADTVVGGVQAGRRISRSLSGFVSYTGIDQSVNNSTYLNAVYAQNAFSGLNNVFAVGLTFAPGPLHRGR